MREHFRKWGIPEEKEKKENKEQREGRTIEDVLEKKNGEFLRFGVGCTRQGKKEDNREDRRILVNSLTSRKRELTDLWRMKEVFSCMATVTLTFISFYEFCWLRTTTGLGIVFFYIMLLESHLRIDLNRIHSYIEKGLFIRLFLLSCSVVGYFPICLCWVCDSFVV